MTAEETTISVYATRDQVAEAFEVLRRVIEGSSTIGPAQVRRGSEGTEIGIRLRGDKGEVARQIAELTEIPFEVRVITDSGSGTR